MYCSHCGFKVSDEATFCPKCGMQLDKEPNLSKEPPKGEAIGKNVEQFSWKYKRSLWGSIPRTITCTASISDEIMHFLRRDKIPFAKVEPGQVINISVNGIKDIRLQPCTSIFAWLCMGLLFSILPIMLLLPIIDSTIKPTMGAGVLALIVGIVCAAYMYRFQLLHYRLQITDKDDFVCGLDDLKVNVLEALGQTIAKKNGITLAKTGNYLGKILISVGIGICIAISGVYTLAPRSLLPSDFWDTTNKDTANSLIESSSVLVEGSPLEEMISPQAAGLVINGNGELVLHLDFVFTNITDEATSAGWEVDVSAFQNGVSLSSYDGNDLFTDILPGYSINSYKEYVLSNESDIVEIVFSESFGWDENSYSITIDPSELPAPEDNLSQESETESLEPPSEAEVENAAMIMVEQWLDDPNNPAGDFKDNWELINYDFSWGGDKGAETRYVLYATVRVYIRYEDSYSPEDFSVIGSAWWNGYEFTSIGYAT